ncbi:MAG: DUF3501 family protein [Candidatus Binatia bacterium]
MNSSIRPVTLEDVVGLDRYEAIRDDVRRRIIELKRARRVSLGPEMTFVFENHDTMYFQVHEMLRAERITDLDAVREELAVYNALLPRPGELSATLLIEITQQARVPERLLEFQGIDGAVWLEVGAATVPGEFEAGRSKEDKLSAVQYVRFGLPPAARAAFREGAERVRLVVDHPRYRHATVIDGAVRASLAADLENS